MEFTEAIMHAKKLPAAIVRVYRDEGAELLVNDDGSITVVQTPNVDDITDATDWKVEAL